MWPFCPPKWARALRIQISTLQQALEANHKETKELIMATGNDALQALNAQTTELEGRFSDLKTAVQKEVSDAVTDITKILGTMVIKPGDVQAITARLKVLSDNTKDLTTSTTAADDEIEQEVNPPVVPPVVPVVPVEPPVVPVDAGTPPQTIP